MNALLQNTANDNQSSAEPIYTYTLNEYENESLEEMLFRLFEKVRNESLS